MEESFIGELIYLEKGQRRTLAFNQGITKGGGPFEIALEVIGEEGRMTLRLTVTPDATQELVGLTMRMSQTVGSADQIFLNGYQSWTESRLFRTKEYIPPLRGPLPHLVNTSGDYTFYKGSHKPGQMHAWSFTSLQIKDGPTIFWLDTKPETGFTIFEWDCPEDHVTMRKDVGGCVLQQKTVLMEVEIWHEGGTEVSSDRFAGFAPQPVKAPVSGWTSWYNHYTKIDEQIILDNLRAFSFREVPIDVFQIDDGWQPAVGDWTSANAKFPKGMGFLADQIHRCGYQAGLWLAPLIVEQKSTIYQQHRDWLLTHDGERLVEAGFNPGWGGLLHGTYFVLNLDLPDVQNHLRQVFDTVLNIWGFDLVKLDFLFAASLVPAGGQSRGQRMQSAFALLRECCGEKLILGCGVPLAAAWGSADYCRIGPDIGLSWELGIAKAIHLRERISTHNALHNTINRRHFSGRMFGNDPDVFILRHENNDLSPLQQRTLLFINHIFGDLLFTSDDISAYDAQTMHLYRSTFPLLPKRIIRVENDDDQYRIWLEINDQNYFVAANLSREDVKLALPNCSMFEQGGGIVSAGSMAYLRPFETRIYLQHSEQLPSIWSSDLHIFPGSEVLSFGTDDDGILLNLHPHVGVSGKLVLRLHENAPSKIKVNGQQQPIVSLEGIKQVTLDVKDGKFA